MEEHWSDRYLQQTLFNFLRETSALHPQLVAIIRRSSQQQLQQQSQQSLSLLSMFGFGSASSSAGKRRKSYLSEAAFQQFLLTLAQLLVDVLWTVCLEQQQFTEWGALLFNEEVRISTSDLLSLS